MYAHEAEAILIIQETQDSKGADEFRCCGYEAVWQLDGRNNKI